MKAATGLSVKMTYEVRSGECPTCGTSFDDSKGMVGDKRYCPKCQTFALGKLEQTGIIKEK